MSDHHNTARYGETWPQERIDKALAELEKISDLVIVSGGWAWHFMSPAGHRELKHAHDHKDIDLFVRGVDAGKVKARLARAKFTQVGTRFDRMYFEHHFSRYEKIVDLASDRLGKITIDLFVRENVPSIEIEGWKIVEPSHLLGLYGSIHGSKTCFAVQAARHLIDAGIDPVGNPKLVEIPKELVRA